MAKENKNSPSGQNEITSNTDRILTFDIKVEGFGIVFM